MGFKCLIFRNLIVIIIMKQIQFRNFFSILEHSEVVSTNSTLGGLSFFVSSGSGVHEAKPMAIVAAKIIDIFIVFSMYWMHCQRSTKKKRDADSCLQPGIAKHPHNKTRSHHAVSMRWSYLLCVLCIRFGDFGYK